MIAAMKMRSGERRVPALMAMACLAGSHAKARCCPNRAVRLVATRRTLISRGNLSART
jgi:hypothetical protein